MGNRYAWFNQRSSPPGALRNEASAYSFRGALLFIPVLLVSGCTVGPNYHKPTAPTAPAFKESAVVPPPNLPDGGWKQVSPNDSALRANWWEIYQDPQLDKLEQQVAVSNQTLKASYEQYMQARAAIQVYRAQYFPTVQAGPSATRERQSSNRPLRVTGSKSTYNDLFFRGKFPGSLIYGATSGGKWNRSAVRPKPRPLTWRTSI